MKTKFMEFLKEARAERQGDQEEFKDHAFKVAARRLLTKAAKEKKAKRKAAQRSKKDNRKGA